MGGGVVLVGVVVFLYLLALYARELRVLLLAEIEYSIIEFL